MLKNKCLVDRIQEMQSENEELHQKLEEMTVLCQRQEEVILECTQRETESTVAIIENYEAAGRLASALIEIYEKLGDEK